MAILVACLVVLGPARTPALSVSNVPLEKVYYLPFGVTTFLPVTPNSPERMHDMTSLWAKNIDELRALLENKGKECKNFGSSFVRLAIQDGSRTVIAVDSKGRVQHHGKLRQLSNAELEELKLWIYLHIPKPDMPAAIIPPSSPQGMEGFAARFQLP
ncbi:MAG: hypothetical protein K1X67_03405 [Fimbriimonadaceae bacterium]|nr:hypothetical protein [Fimbriimonadaceae bacterium]